MNILEYQNISERCINKNIKSIVEFIDKYIKIVSKNYIDRVSYKDPIYIDINWTIIKKYKKLYDILCKKYRLDKKD